MRRTIEIDAAKNEDGSWFRDDFGNVVLPYDRLEDKLAGIRTVLEDLGGYYLVAPKRVQRPGGVFECVGFILRYDSGMPAAKPAEEQPAAEPEPEPEAESEQEPEPVAVEA